VTPTRDSRPDGRQGAGDGGRLSYADFHVATALIDGYGNIGRWYDRLNQVDAWREPFAGLA
jgi:glutathione S-transferase